MGSESIFAILVDEEPGMDWKGMPGASEGEFLRELLRSKMNEVEPNWSGIAMSVLAKGC